MKKSLWGGGADFVQQKFEWITFATTCPHTFAHTHRSHLCAISFLKSETEHISETIFFLKGAVKIAVQKEARQLT